MDPMVRVAILSAALCTMASDMVIVPILDLLYGAFPDSNVTLVALTYTVAGFAFIPSSLLTPALCRRFNMKKLMMLGTILCIIGGGFGGMVTNIYYIVGMHFVEGVGAGFCANIIPIYIARLCKGEKDVMRMGALNGTAGTFLGLVATLLSGFMATRFGWKAAYYVYFIEIAVLILQAFFLPEGEPETNKNHPEKATLNARILRWLAEVFAFSLFINLMWTHQAGYLAEKGLGGADVSGVASACIQIGGFFASFTMAWLMQKAKQYHQNICFFLFTVAACLMLYSSLPVHFFAASLVWGVGQGLIYPYLWAQATLVSPDKASVSSIISWTTVAWYLAVGMTTIVYQPIAVIFHNGTSTFAMTVTMVAFVILFIYRLCMGTVERKMNII